MIKIDIRGIDVLTKHLDLTAKEIAKATRNAIDGTATTVRNLAVNEAVKVYNIDKARLITDNRGKSTVYVKRTTQSQPFAVITFRGRKGERDRPGLNHYVNWASVRRGPGQYPTYQIKRGGVIKSAEPSFFMRFKTTGGWGIVEKHPTELTSTGKRKLVRRTGPNLKQMLEKDIKVVVLKQGQLIFFTKLREQIAKAINKRTE